MLRKVSQISRADGKTRWTMNTEEPPPTTDSAKTIKAINKDTVHKICSGQVSKFEIPGENEKIQNKSDGNYIFLLFGIFRRLYWA